MRGKQWDLANGTKPCPKCGEIKPLEAFGSNKYSASGFTSYCKPCMSEMARAYRSTPEGKKAHYESTLKWVAGLPDAEIAAGTKTCPKCNVLKAFAYYPKNKRNKHGIGTYCLDCAAEGVRARRATPEGAQAHRTASKRWREANLERHADNNAKRTYGLEHGGYATMLESQGGKCAICDTTEPGSRLNRFHIDHCHTSKDIRGLLCELCNRGLGSFKDSPELLDRAANYIRLTKGCGEG